MTSRVAEAHLVQAKRHTGQLELQRAAALGNHKVVMVFVDRQRAVVPGLDQEDAVVNGNGHVLPVDRQPCGHSDLQLRV